ncbi:hypothetical protein Tco_1359813 [Tanacetum coccineum]
MISRLVGRAIKNVMPYYISRTTDNLKEVIQKELEEFKKGGIMNDFRNEMATYRDFTACDVPKFYATLNPIASTRWLFTVEGSFPTSCYNEKNKVNFASNFLRDSAKMWFTTPPGRRFVDGMVATIDPVELESFSTNQMKLILTNCLGYDENSATFLYIKKPSCSLDSGLIPLDDAIQDNELILTYTQTQHNRLHVYVSRVELSPLVAADQSKYEGYEGMKAKVKKNDQNRQETEKASDQVKT